MRYHTRSLAGAVVLAALLLGGAACGMARDQAGENAPLSEESLGSAPVDLDSTTGPDGGTDAVPETEDGGDDAGGDSGTDAGPPPAPPVTPSAKDCVSYDPENLTVVSGGATGWYVRDGSHSMMVFDTQAHANDAVKVARNYTKSCYIGRGNDRADRSRYIHQYWEVPSGLPLGQAPARDCTKYDPTKLTVTQDGDDGWYLTDGSTQLMLLDTAADAERARLVAAGRTNLCLIGASNTRPDWYRYTMEYWL
jgi:hypothetical protein